LLRFALFLHLVITFYILWFCFLFFVFCILYFVFSKIAEKAK